MKLRLFERFSKATKSAGTFLAERANDASGFLSERNAKFGRAFNKGLGNGSLVGAEGYILLHMFFENRKIPVEPEQLYEITNREMADLSVGALALLAASFHSYKLLQNGIRRNFTGSVTGNTTGVALGASAAIAGHLGIVLTDEFLGEVGRTDYSHNAANVLVVEAPKYSALRNVVFEPN